jgi:hypothetical protein
MAFLKMPTGIGLKLLQERIDLYLVALNITMCVFIESQKLRLVGFDFCDL